MIKKNQHNIKEIVHQAIYPNGKKNFHQKRITINVLNKYMDNVIDKLDKVGNINTFDDILNITSSASIKGIGKLTEYDMALGIGKQFGLLPDKVYLHAGTEIGAIKLGLIQKKGEKEYLTLDELPTWLKVIEPYKIEDFLCIHKNDPSKENLKKYLKNADKTIICFPEKCTCQKKSNKKLSNKC